MMEHGNSSWPFDQVNLLITQFNSKIIPEHNGEVVYRSSQQQMSTCHGDDREIRSKILVSSECVAEEVKG